MCEPRKPVNVYSLKTARPFYMGGKLCITGTITGDMTGEYPIGTVVRTSELRAIDFERHFAVTQNSIYYFDEFLPFPT